MAVMAAWAFPSSSGSTTYETVLDEEGMLSCNCPGFIFKKKGQARGCKHTRQIEPYTARVLARTLTPELVGAWLGISSSTPASSPAVIGTPPIPSSLPTTSLPPLVERKRRRIDFEE
jgi:hypothetical protein